MPDNANRTYCSTHQSLRNCSSQRQLSKTSKKTEARQAIITQATGPHEATTTHKQATIAQRHTFRLPSPIRPRHCQEMLCHRRTPEEDLGSRRYRYLIIKLLSVE